MAILFDARSLALESKTFLLERQQTITAAGLAPGDFITFEALTLASGAPAEVCGCYITAAEASVIASLSPLLCSRCESDTGDRRVQVTATHPSIILDTPMGSLLRAVYHGTGLEDGTVVVTINDSSTQNLTSAMRGCPCACCEDFQQTWEDTGDTRCNDISLVVEVRQMSNCGNFRWVPATTQQTPYWAATGQTRCGAFLVEQQEQTECEVLRWQPTALVVWAETGEQRCFNNLFERQERNTCGDLRWVSKGALVWTPTGEYDCINGLLNQEQRNLCGGTRWVNTAEVCGDSEHSVISIVGLAPTAGGITGVTEGAQACFRVTLNAPVSGSPLVLNPVLSGADYNRHRYSVSPVTVPIGATYADLCIVTTDDSVVDGTEALCLAVAVSGRVTSAVAPYCLSVFNNDTLPAPVISNHTITTITPVATPVAEGATVCWNVTLDAPVTGAPLTLTGVLSGGEQVVHNYPAPSLTIPIGVSTGQICVTTLNDAIDESVLSLCLQFPAGGRLLTTIPAACVNITDDDVPVGGSVHTVVSVTPVNASVIEGQNACWTITLNAPVAGTDLFVPIALRGSDYLRNNYNNAGYFIPVGQSSVVACVLTTNDSAVDGTEVLGLEVLIDPRISASQPVSNINVTDNDTATNSVHNIVSVVASPNPVVQGGQVCFTVTLDTPVVGTPLTITGVLSGAEQTENSYTAPSVVIPVGQLSGQLCVTTDADATGPAQSLCLTAQVIGRVLSSPTGCVTVTGVNQVGLPATYQGDFNPCALYDCDPVIEGNNVLATYTVSVTNAGGVSPSFGPVGSSNWLNGSGVNPADYEVRLIGIDFNDGANLPNVWYNAGTPILEWSQDILCGGNTSVVATLDIRHIATQQIVTSKEVYDVQVYTGPGVECP